MKVLQINQNHNIGSTGRIMKEINDMAISKGYASYMLCAYSTQADHNEHLYVTEQLPQVLAIRKNILKHRLTGLTGYSSILSTKKALRWIERVNPDIIHIHNVHGNWINLRMLFSFLKQKKIPIVWTLHDCWSFTGRCSHFESSNCFQWRNGCKKCPVLNVYPVSYFFDFSSRMWRDKRAWLSGFQSMNIVTPSRWLADYVKQSFLASYNISVINNGIDIGQFCIQKNKSKYINGETRKIILGVASTWTRWKGIDDFIQLFSLLDSTKYVIVLVGLNSRQLSSLPKGILGINRTQNVTELAELYSQADVFVNPTYQDNYPTVNLEALACGTPVITYQTGGSVESVSPDVGLVVEKGDVIGLADAIKMVANSGVYSPQNCRHYAEMHFDKNQKYLDYIQLYDTLYHKSQLRLNEK